MVRLGLICEYLESLAPARLSAEWDNVGLLAGDHDAEVQRVMTCLTMTADTVAEAIEQQANLVVVHHPLPFKPLVRITTDSPEGRYLLDLLGAQIHLFSPHTAWDSATGGQGAMPSSAMTKANGRPIT